MTTRAEGDGQPPQDGHSYYAGSIRTLRNLLVSANPVSWTGLSARTSQVEGDDLPEATRRPERIAPRSRLSAKDVFAGTANGLQPAPDVGEKLYGGDADQAQLVNMILQRCGQARDPYDDEDDTQYTLFAVCPSYLSTALEGQEQLIQRVVATMNDNASQPYLVVLFAAPSQSVPVKQLVSYYRALSAEARRNVKRIWIVHTSLVTRL